MKGSMHKVGKVVALETAKTRSTSLGCSFPVGLDWLPVVGGLPFITVAENRGAQHG